MTPLARVAVFALLLPAAHAQDAKFDAAKARATAAANLKKAGVGKPTVHETGQFVLATTLPEEKAKALGEVLEKVVPVARKAAQLEAKEQPWKGKLTVYYLPDGSDFKGFFRNVVMDQPGGTYYSLRGDEPFLVDPADVPAKATEADQFAAAAAVVAGAVLKGKAGTAALPDWLTDGFGRVAAARAEGLASKRYQAYKAASRALAFGPKGGKPPAVTELWAETKPAGAEVLAASFADYLAFGPGAANFPKLVAGFRPDENGNTPAPAAAFEAAGWKDLGMLDAAWRKWAATGK
ncbi:MAG: hypothetical protein C0501_17885 [Isosphaera sp.]|nr:hypothetical protein [Isosphaera sp.]